MIDSMPATHRRYMLGVEAACEGLSYSGAGFFEGVRPLTVSHLSDVIETSENRGLKVNRLSL